MRLPEVACDCGAIEASNMAVMNSFFMCMTMGFVWLCSVQNGRIISIGGKVDCRCESRSWRTSCDSGV